MNDATMVETTHPWGSRSHLASLIWVPKKHFMNILIFCCCFCLLPLLPPGECISFRLLGCTRGHRYVSFALSFIQLCASRTLMVYESLTLGTYTWVWFSFFGQDAQATRPRDQLTCFARSYALAFIPFYALYNHRSNLFAFNLLPFLRR